MTTKKLDQFYTNPKIAKKLFTSLGDLRKYHLLEPSAGTGSFSNLFPNDSTKIDLEPKQDDIKQMDFFSYYPTISNPIFTIGNPPFGKNSSLAVKFFNHAAEFSDKIGFIVPKTFRKISIINKLNPNFHLADDVEMPPMSFVYLGKPYDVPCCFQLWEKRKAYRQKIIPRKETKMFDITSKENADFMVQRVGAGAGKVSKDFHKSPNSHYYIKSHVANLSERMDNLYSTFQLAAKNSAGCPSLSRDEMIRITESG